MFHLGHVASLVPQLRISFFNTSLQKGDCILNQWRHGAMVGCGKRWLTCIDIYMQKLALSACITAHQSFMMACIYTNTQTCTYIVHTVYLYTYCTHAHTVYACAWKTYGSDPTTVTNWWDLVAKWTLEGLKTVWFIISKVHWKSWWLWKRSALSFLLF